MKGQEKEYQQVQMFFDSLLKMDGALRRLDCDTQQSYIAMKSDDFSYITSIIELTNTHNFSKFYKRINDDEFTLGGFIVKRGGWCKKVN